MQFLKIMNWRSLLVIALCGFGFYYAFEYRTDRRLHKDRIEGTGFIVKIIDEGLTQEDKKKAMEKTLLEYQARINGLKIPGATVEKKGPLKILIQIPGIDSAEALEIKKIMLQRDRIEYKLMVYGPMEE
jgi:preprotein translocase subunit SecD